MERISAPGPFEPRAVAEYREYPVHPALAPHLICIWTQVVPAHPSTYLHRVLPDACADIVCVDGAPPILAGPATLPVIAALPAGAVIVGARFRPGVAPSWVGAAASEIVNMDVDLRNLWGRSASGLAQRLDEAGAAGRRLAVLKTALLERVGQVPSNDPLVCGAVASLAKGEILRVEDLSRRVGLSQRHLLRRLRERVGYGPKMLDRILRLQRTLHAARVGCSVSGRLAALAAAAGYADQAHMAREIRHLTGLTSSELFRDGVCTLAMSDLFKTDVPRAH